MLAAGLGDAALPHAFSAGVSGGESSHAPKDAAFLNLGELVGLKTRSAALMTSIPLRHRMESTSCYLALGGLVFDEGLEPLLVLQLRLTASI